MRDVEPASAPTPSGIGRMVSLARPARSGSSFVSAEMLPDRGMMVLGIRAELEGRGLTDLLMTPLLADAAERLTAAEAPFDGNASFSFGAATLVPFANRIRGDLDPDGMTIATDVLGQRIRLPANGGGADPLAERCAIHGLMLSAVADRLERSTDAVSDKATAWYDDAFAGHWPSHGQVAVTTELRADAFRLEIIVRNAGKEPMPVGVGWHPYFALPSGDRTQARLRLPARRRALVNNYTDVFPTGKIVEVAGSPHDFTAPPGRALGDLFMDDCFVDLETNAAGHTVCEIVDPEAAYGLRITATSPHIRGIQVYAPTQQGFVVVEPQFNLADPYGSEWPAGTDTGMVVLAPGASVSYEVVLELFSV